MSDSIDVFVNPISGELLVWWKRYLQALGDLPVSLNLTYRRNNDKTTALGKGVAGALTAHLEDKGGEVWVYKDNGHVVRYLSLGSGPDRQFIPPWDKYNPLTLDDQGDFVETRSGIGEWVYDGDDGRLVRYADEAGHTTLYEYTGDKLTRVLLPDDRTVTVGYDGDYINAVTDYAGRTVSFAHDGEGHLTEITDAAGSSWSLHYNGDGKVDRYTDPEGYVFTFEGGSGSAGPRSLGTG